MTGGDTGLAEEVLGLFREQCDLWMRLLEPSTDTQDWGNAAHTIKGSARGIGAWRLADLCGQAEDEARAAIVTRDGKRAWRDDISFELDRVLHEIARMDYKALLASLRG
jgi:HPt (histidine-containing phosphotransfer) domain-containing protein